MLLQLQQLAEKRATVRLRNGRLSAPRGCATGRCGVYGGGLCGRGSSAEEGGLSFNPEMKISCNPSCLWRGNARRRGEDLTSTVPHSTALLHSREGSLAPVRAQVPAACGAELAGPASCPSPMSIKLAICDQRWSQKQVADEEDVVFTSPFLRGSAVGDDGACSTEVTTSPRGRTFRPSALSPAWLSPHGS